MANERTCVDCDSDLPPRLRVDRCPRCSLAFYAPKIERTRVNPPAVAAPPKLAPVPLSSSVVRPAMSYAEIRAKSERIASERRYPPPITAYHYAART